MRLEHVRVEAEVPAEVPAGSNGHGDALERVHGERDSEEGRERRLRGHEGFEPAPGADPLSGRGCYPALEGHGSQANLSLGRPAARRSESPTPERRAIIRIRVADG